MITAILRYKTGATRRLYCTGDIYRTNMAIHMVVGDGPVSVPMEWLNLPFCSFIKEND